jgi:UDP-N-acetyl-D-galactosamine dehydrogenase
MPHVAVIGLGYVGLPLVVAFGRIMPTTGYDIKADKVQSCQAGLDPAREINSSHMALAMHARYTNDPNALQEADFILVAVPTPVDQAHRPDLQPLISASETIGRHMKRGATIVYESTVYPGATEDDCIPVIERTSGLKWKRDFFVGYSPERINPGDREHTLVNTLKVVSGDTPETLDRVAALYERVVEAGVFRASSIRAAEACKVIENTQRDLNIALMNELALIFGRMGLDTREVLQAAGTKWNFLKFQPGLVGGHCIGVDPYYLTHQAEKLGYHPQVILAGRRINDGMAAHVAQATIKELIAAGHPIKGARINVLGLAFKENCADTRNSKVVDLVRELRSYGTEVAVHDPWVDADEAQGEHSLELCTWEDLPTADALVLAVAHRDFMARGHAGLSAKLLPQGVLIDVKAVLDPEPWRRQGVRVWRL